MPAPSCLFCQIADGEVEADVVHSTDHVLAFRDINPQAPVHVLLIPKEHIESARSLKDRNAGLLAEIFQAAAHLARAEKIDRSGWRLVTNGGAGGAERPPPALPPPGRSPHEVALG